MGILSEIYHFITNYKALEKQYHDNRENLELLYREHELYLQSEEQKKCTTSLSIIKR